MTICKRLVLFLALIWLAAASPLAAGIDDGLEATCRITAADGGRGTGCVFEISRGWVYVLTAAHVVGRDPAVQCEFWRAGHQSRPIRAVVMARVESCDAALLALDAAQFGGLLPKAIPLAPRDRLLAARETVTSAGCAGGAWSTAWKGHVLGYAGDDLRFVPAPANGRSGSAVFDAEGRMIVGLLRARTVDSTEGIATSVQALYRAMDRSAADKPSLERLPLTPVQCAGGWCPSPGGSTWPTRPSPAPSASPWPTTPASVELGPTNDRLDRITDLLRELRPSPVPPAPVAPALPSAVDETARRVAEAAQSDAETARRETSRLREAVNALVGEPDTLLGRIGARRDKVQQELGGEAGVLDLARAYVRDLASEKLSDGSLGLSMGKVLSGALGLSGPLALGIGGGLWLLSRRIGRKLENDEPLLVQRLVDRLSDKLDAWRNRSQSGQ